MTGRRLAGALWEHFHKTNNGDVVRDFCEKLRKDGGASNSEKKIERRHPTRYGRTMLRRSSEVQDVDNPQEVVH